MGEERGQPVPATDTATAATCVDARPSGHAVASDAGTPRPEPTFSGRSVEQRSARRAHTPEVAGSNPAAATIPVALVLTLPRFAELFPGFGSVAMAQCHTDVVVACERYGITNPEHLAAACAQWAHETMGGRYMTELWGPTPQQLKYDPDPPSTLARRLGNDLPGDGYKFRGRGLCMLTGASNYRQAQREFMLPLLAEPDMVAKFPLAAMVGAWFFVSHNLLGLDFEAQTRKLNGGVNGLPDRLEKWAKARRVLGLP